MSQRTLLRVFWSSWATLVAALAVMLWCSTADAQLHSQLLVSVPYPAPYTGGGLTLASSNNAGGAGNTIDCHFNLPSPHIIEDIWMNQSDKTLAIVSVQVWMGAFAANRYDLGSAMMRGSDRAVLYFNNWDRYAEPTGFSDREYRLDPGLLIAPGDTLIVWSWCTAFDQPGSLASILTTMRFVWR